MFKPFLKGMYYIPNENEDPYYILKNANKNKLNFIIIEYTNNSLFDNSSYNKKHLSNLFYIQEKIHSFERKYKTTVGILCFKCRSIIGTIKILLSKTIFGGEILKLKNFYLWCYLNNPILILSNNNLPHLKNENISHFFKLYSDNFIKTSENYINLLNQNINLTPIYTNNGFIFIKNVNNCFFDFLKLKQFICSEIRSGNFYTSNTDKFYLDINAKSLNQNIKLNLKLNSNYALNQTISLINEKNEVIKNQNIYDLRKIDYSFDIKNNANKLLVFKITCTHELFALTKPIYLNNLFHP